MFKKIDRFFGSLFAIPFIRKLEEQQSFLMSLKAKNMTVDDGLIILDKLLQEEKSCNILV